MADQQAGILNFLNSPIGQGILGSIAGGLAGGGRTAAQNIGRGLLGGLGAYNAAQDNQLQADQRAFQQEQIDKQRKIDALAPQFYRTPTQNALSLGGGPTLKAAGLLPSAQPSFDTEGYGKALMGIDPMRGVQLQAALAKETPFNKVDPEKFTAESVAKFARTRNYGDLVAARKLDIAPDGQVVDLFNATPGQSFSAPIQVNQGNKISFVRPSAGLSLPVGMSPDAAAANAVARGNLQLGRDRLNFEKTQPKGQYDSERGLMVDPRTGAATPVTMGGQPLGGKDKPFTEGQAKAYLFGSRMQSSNNTLSDLEAQGVRNSGAFKRFAQGTGNVIGLGTESLGGTLSDVLGTATNWTQSDSEQQVEQARRDFINAVLRRESGAAISPKEFSSAEQQYFPQPGDSDAVISQKMRNRQLAIDGMFSEIPEGKRPSVTKANTNQSTGWSIKPKGQ